MNKLVTSDSLDCIQEISEHSNRSLMVAIEQQASEQQAEPADKTFHPFEASLV